MRLHITYILCIFSLMIPFHTALSQIKTSSVGCKITLVNNTKRMVEFQQASQYIPANTRIIPGGSYTYNVPCSYLEQLRPLALKSKSPGVVASARNKKSLKFNLSEDVAAVSGKCGECTCYDKDIKGVLKTHWGLPYCDCHC